MFKKAIPFILFAMSFSLQAQADDQKFSCNNVGGTEEWTISVDLQAQKAAFFDNDATVVVPQTEVMVIETMPSQLEYSFEGADPHGGRGATMKIVFNATKKTAYILLKVPGKKTKELEAKDGCQADNGVDIGG